MVKKEATKKKIVQAKVPMIVKTETKTYVSAKYTFTEEELKNISIQLADGIEEKNVLDGELATLKAEFKSKIESVNNAIMLNSQYIRNKTEMRRYYCTLSLNFKTKKRVWTDSATGRIIKTDDLYAEDYQTKLNFEEAAKKEKEKKTVPEKEKGEK